MAYNKQMRLKRLISVFMMVAFVATASMPVAVSHAADKANPQMDQSMRKGEQGKVMDYRQFRSRQVQEAYWIAQQIPWVLDSIKCFCYCDESPAFNHTSLLSCYVDTHAST